MIPVVVTVLLSSVIPVIVGGAVRRGDRSGRGTARPDADTGALFVVRNRRWQAALFRVLGIVLLVVGGFFTIVSVARTEELEGPGPLVGATGITVAGAVFVVLAMGIHRFRVEAFDDHLTVRPWFRATRVVALTDIGSVRPAPNALGGVDVRDVGGRMLFTATRISIGYTDLVAFLQQSTPRQQTTAPAVPGDVAPWQGASLRAELYPLPRGRKGTLESGVLLTAGDVSAPMFTSEIADLLHHRVGIVESTTADPLVFLCWPDSGSPTSIVWESTKDLPAESLALLSDPMDAGPAAVVTGTELTDFSEWIAALPR